jgi:hypothetical protein
VKDFEIAKESLVNALYINLPGSRGLLIGLPLSGYAGQVWSG